MYVSSFLPLSAAVATKVGEILRTAWLRGTEGVCAEYRNTSSLVILVRPPCGPPAEGTPPERRMHYHDTWCRCQLRMGDHDETVPPRSQTTLPPLGYPNVSSKVVAAWEAATGLL